MLPSFNEVEVPRGAGRPSLTDLKRSTILYSSDAGSHAAAALYLGLASSASLLIGTMGSLPFLAVMGALGAAASLGLSRQSKALSVYESLFHSLRRNGRQDRDVYFKSKILEEQRDKNSVKKIIKEARNLLYCSDAILFGQKPTEDGTKLRLSTDTITLILQQQCLSCLGTLAQKNPKATLSTVGISDEIGDILLYSPGILLNAEIDIPELIATRNMLRDQLSQEDRLPEVDYGDLKFLKLLGSLRETQSWQNAYKKSERQKVATALSTITPLINKMSHTDHAKLGRISASKGHAFLRKKHFTRSTLTHFAL